MRDIEQIPQLPVRTEKHWQQYLIDSLLAVGEHWPWQGSFTWLKN